MIGKLVSRRLTETNLTQWSFIYLEASRIKPITAVQIWQALELALNFWKLNGTVNSSISIYYMALSHKDWELPNSRIWLVEMDIDRGLDFPI